MAQFSGKAARMAHVQNKLAQTSKDKAPLGVIDLHNSKGLPSLENRATGNYRVNFYGNVVKRR